MSENKYFGFLDIYDNPAYFKWLFRWTIFILMVPFSIFLISIPGILFTRVDKSIIAQAQLDSVLIFNTDSRIKIQNKDTLNLIKEAFMKTSFTNKGSISQSGRGSVEVEIEMYTSNKEICRFRIISNHGRFVHIVIHKRKLLKNSKLCKKCIWEMSNEFGDLISIIFSSNLLNKESVQIDP